MSSELILLALLYFVFSPDRHFSKNILGQVAAARTFTFPIVLLTILIFLFRALV
jgi:hypothetical protein